LIFGEKVEGWEVGRYGCSNDGLDERDLKMMVVGGREGGREGVDL